MRPKRSPPPQYEIKQVIRISLDNLQGTQRSRFALEPLARKTADLETNRFATEGRLGDRAYEALLHFWLRSNFGNICPFTRAGPGRRACDRHVRRVQGTLTRFGHGALSWGHGLFR